MKLGDDACECCASWHAVLDSVSSTKNNFQRFNFGV